MPHVNAANVFPLPSLAWLSTTQTATRAVPQGLRHSGQNAAWVTWAPLWLVRATKMRKQVQTTLLMLCPWPVHCADVLLKTWAKM